MIPVTRLVSDPAASRSPSERVRFLARHGLADAEPVPLHGGLSAKQFFRIPDSGLVLMEADTGLVARYRRIADYLRQAGLSVPQIHAIDEAGVRLLVEDLGDRSLARCIDQAADPKAWLARAVCALARLERLEAPSNLMLPIMDADRLAAETQTFTEGAVKGLIGSDAAEEIGERLAATWADLGLGTHPAPQLVLGDFEPENLQDLPRRRGVRRCGILDFDDAFLGARTYDLASIVQSARRRTSLRLGEELVAIYAKELEASFSLQRSIAHQVTAWSIQRHCRILGLFVRLALHGGKPSYLHHLPGLCDYLEGNLKSAGFERLAETFTRYDVLARLRAAAAVAIKTGGSS